MAQDQETNQLAAINVTLSRMEQRLSAVCNDVEDLKKDRQEGPQHRTSVNSGVVHSTLAQSVVITPGNSGGVVDDVVVPSLTWAERMDLEDELSEVPDNTTDERSGGDKAHLTQVQESTKDFLRKAFVPMNNAERRQLRQQFIIPDAMFTASPRLDKVMATECSKSTKSADQQLSRMQALFLDAVGPLSGLLDDINKGTEVTLDDMEGAVKAALTFMGNASSQCTSLRRVGILEEYNKDLVSFSQESEDLFASATGTLFGPSFAEKAAEHLKQLQTLRRAKGSGSKSSQGFLKAPPHYAQWGGGGKSYTLQRRQGNQPYSRGVQKRGPQQQSKR